MSQFVYLNNLYHTLQQSLKTFLYHRTTKISLNYVVHNFTKHFTGEIVNNILFFSLYLRVPKKLLLDREMDDTGNRQ